MQGKPELEATAEEAPFAQGPCQQALSADAVEGAEAEHPDPEAVLELGRRGALSHLVALVPGLSVAGRPTSERADSMQEARDDGATRQPPILQHISNECQVPLETLCRIEALELLARVPQNSAGELTSVGSIKHAEGNCDPCAYWFKGMCTHGVECRHCHVLHAGQRARRLRPSKSARHRARHRMQRAVGDEPPDMMDEDVCADDGPEPLEEASLAKADRSVGQVPMGPGVFASLTLTTAAVIRSAVGQQDGIDDSTADCESKATVTQL